MDREISAKIHETVRHIDPGAEVYIFGSRARETASADSDWDVLVLTSRPVTHELKQNIRHALYEIEWDHECVISSIIHSREEWSSPRMRMTPFYQNLAREAIRL